VHLVPGTTPVRARVLQDRGTMEFARKGLRGPGQMRAVESFKATIEVDASS
jgi:hypothetical protein